MVMAKYAKCLDLLVPYIWIRHETVATTACSTTR